MTTLPPITITITTYASDDLQGVQRTKAARQAWRSWATYLRYDGELRVHVADDGSERRGYNEAWWRKVQVSCPLGSLTYSRQDRGGVGASLNAGWRQAIADGALALYPVDDWQLLGPLDLTPWAELILDHPEGPAGVRLGPPHPGMTGTVEHWENRWFLRPDRHHFVFAQRPALFDPVRMTLAYGWHDEGINALECERLYNERYCGIMPGAAPDVVLALLHPWDHIYTTSLSDADPTTRLAAGGAA